METNKTDTLLKRFDDKLFSDALCNYLMKVRFLAILLLAGCAGNSDNGATDRTAVGATAVPNLNFSVGSGFKHHTAPYTQRLLLHNRPLFQTSGATTEG